MRTEEESRILIAESGPVPRGKTQIPTALLGSLAACVLAGILVAGLWPFHAPKNQVIWLRGVDGLYFGRYGSLLSSGALDLPSTSNESAGSLEMWLHPRKAWQRGTILSFDAPRSPLQLSLRQSYLNLEMRFNVRDLHHGMEILRSHVHNVFSRRKLIFITITSGAGEDAVYVNGDLVQSSRASLPIAQSLHGRLVVANSPIENDSWAGTLRGLAIYREALSPKQVKQHYESWERNGRPEIAATENNIALYLFSERAGSIVHNQVKGAADLVIPVHYTIVREKLLETPWSEYKSNGMSLNSVLENIVGLIPLGFIFCAFFCCYPMRIKHPALLAVLLGFATSVTIEVLQSFLPTRDSGMTDIITNTFGAYLGVLLYRSSWVRNTLSRVPLLPYFLP